MRVIREKGIILVGMLLATAVILFLCYTVWHYLVSKEAKYYGNTLTARLLEEVRELDGITNAAFNKSFYDHLHKHRLQQMKLGKDRTVQKLSEELGSFLHNPYGAMGFFTHCSESFKQECYFDHFFHKGQEQINEEYQPMSRPWYIVTKDHTNWVVLSFMMMLKSVPSYPRTSGVAFARRIVLSENPEPDEGVWFVVASPNSTREVTIGDNTTIPYLDMLIPEKAHLFSSFDVAFSSIYISDDQLSGKENPSPDCDGITNPLGLGYHASLRCFLGRQPIQYMFDKRYDHPVQLWILIGVGILLWVAIYKFLAYVARLQVENANFMKQVERSRLINAIGAKLMHDLGKGVLWQLNRLYEGHEDRYSTHMRYVQLVNKYISLLGNNLRGERETHWVPFTPEKCREYMQMVLGDQLQLLKHENGPFLQVSIDDQVKISIGSAWPHFVVPEVSFFRIIKNIIENYQTHGTAPFRLTMSLLGSRILLESENRALHKAKEERRTSQFGFAIIQQLLVDNFGTETELNEVMEGNVYKLTMSFPKLSKMP